MHIKNALLLSMSLGLASCTLYGIDGNGDTVTHDVATASFSSIQSHGSVDLRIVSSSQHQQVRVTCDSNLTRYIDVFLDGAELVIDESESLNPRGRCEVVVRTPTLSAIEATGSADVVSSGRIVDLGFVNTTGSGDMTISSIETPRLEVRTTGSGDVVLDGQADELELTSTGSGDMEASDLDAGNTKAKTTGSGDLEIHASSTVHVRSSGSGDVDIWGNPEDRDVEVSGSGDIAFH